MCTSSIQRTDQIKTIIFQESIIFRTYKLIRRFRTHTLLIRWPTGHSFYFHYMDILIQSYILMYSNFTLTFLRISITVTWIAWYCWEQVSNDQRKYSWNIEVREHALHNTYSLEITVSQFMSILLRALQSMYQSNKVYQVYLQ